MPEHSGLRRPGWCYFLPLVLALGGCAGSMDAPRSIADLDVVASDEHFALVRLKGRQTTEDLARILIGSSDDAWQIEQITAATGAGPGSIVAVPLAPINVTGVAADRYATLPVLCYHQFTEAAVAGHKLELTAADFEAQLRYLVDADYQFMSIAELSEALSQQRPIPPRSVVLTIDDGYESVYDVAFPLLQKYNARATLFVYTDFIGAGAAVTWAQLREMQASGLIEIESHGKSHSSLAQTPEDKDQASYEARLAAELSASEAEFMANLGAAPRYLSYPYGNSSRTIAELLKDSGYELAATVMRGPNASFVDPYLVHRTMIYGDHSLEDFEALLRSSYKRRRP